MRAYLLVLLIAAAVSFVCTPLALRTARRLKVSTPIRDRDVHSEPTPRLGGLAMFAGVAVTLVIASRMSFLHGIFRDNGAVWGILGGAAVVMLLGVADDIWDLPWWLKLGGQVVGALIVAQWGVSLYQIPLGHIPVSDPLLQVAMTTFLIVLTMNAINFVDGLDGLAAGVAVIGGAAFFIFTYWVTRTASAEDYSNLATLIMAALIGACLGFLPHNFFPAKIFMGDAGSMLIGLLMASAAIAAVGQPVGEGIRRAYGLPALMPIILPIAVMMLPLVDLLLAVVRRTARGRSPFHPDKGHLHHKLIDLGYTHQQSVLIMYLWAAVTAFGVVAFAFFPWGWVLLADAAAFGLSVLLTLHPWARNGNGRDLAAG